MKKEIPKDEYLRKRALRRKKIRKRRLLISFFLFIVVALCVAAILCITVLFPIEKIAVSGSKIYTSAAIEKASGIDIGDNLFMVSQSDAEAKIKKDLPYVDSIEIKRKFPDTLTIKVKDAEEFFVFESDNKFYTVSKNGWVLNELSQPNPDLYTIYGVGVKCKVGAALEYKDINERTIYEEIVGLLEKSNLKINYVDITEKVDIKLGVEDRFEVTLGTANFLEEKIKHLASMCDSIAPEKTGKINLSMWTDGKEQGTFTPGIIS